MEKPWEKLVTGILLTFSLALWFGMLLLLVAAIAGSNSSLYQVIIAIFPWPGLTQFLYLVPTVLHYRRLQDFERVKGISIGAIMMLLLNSTCFSYSITGLKFDYRYSLAITIVLIIVTYRWFNGRR